MNQEAQTGAETSIDSAFHSLSADDPHVIVLGAGPAGLAALLGNS